MSETYNDNSYADLPGKTGHMVSPEDGLSCHREGCRPLGNTGIEISQLGFGCASAWAKSVMGKPMISDSEAQAVFERAYELGIRWFDTGFNYDSAEIRIGKVLKESDVVKREDILISTKFGDRPVDGKWRKDWSAEWMRHSVETSMSRMGIDYIDMLMCHGGTVSEISPELLDALYDLRKKGIVRAVGTSMCGDEMIRHVIKTKCFDFVMLDYNVMRQERDALIKALHDNGIGVIVGAPLAESLYSKQIYNVKSLKDIWYLARAVLHFRGQLIEGRKYRFIENVDGMSGSQIALKFVLSNPNISAAVFGTTSVSHLEDNVKALDIEIPVDVMKRIKAQGAKN